MVDGWWLGGLVVTGLVLRRRWRTIRVPEDFTYTTRRDKDGNRIVLARFTAGDGRGGLYAYDVPVSELQIG